jgi:hypothetical protein
MIEPELTDDEPKTDTRILRQFALLCLVLFGTLAGWHFYHAHPVRAATFAVLAVGIGPLGLLRPQAIRWLFVALVTLTKPIGALVTRVILAVMFYGLFAPIALFFRLTGRDALVRGRRSGSKTYWTDRPRGTDARRYFRQY